MSKFVRIPSLSFDSQLYLCDPEVSSYGDAIACVLIRLAFWLGFRVHWRVVKSAPVSCLKLRWSSMKDLEVTCQSVHIADLLSVLPNVTLWYIASSWDRPIQEVLKILAEEHVEPAPNRILNETRRGRSYRYEQSVVPFGTFERLSKKYCKQSKQNNSAA